LRLERRLKPSKNRAAALAITVLGAVALGITTVAAVAAAAIPPVPILMAMAVRMGAALREEQQL
jgi:CHASE2 domain-containing sensor protein